MTIKLPPPDTHCEDLDTGLQVWSYYEGLVEQVIADQSREIAALKERVEGLSKDAERLDWLESSEVMHGFCHMGNGDFRHYALQQKGYPSVRAVLDAAIVAKGVAG